MSSRKVVWNFHFSNEYKCYFRLILTRVEWWVHCSLFEDRVVFCFSLLLDALFTFGFFNAAREKLFESKKPHNHYDYLLRDKKKCFEADVRRMLLMVYSVNSKLIQLSTTQMHCWWLIFEYFLFFYWNVSVCLLDTSSLSSFLLLSFFFELFPFSNFFSLEKLLLFIFHYFKFTQKRAE